MGARVLGASTLTQVGFPVLEMTHHSRLRLQNEAREMPCCTRKNLEHVSSPGPAGLGSEPTLAL